MPATNNGSRTGDKAACALRLLSGVHPGADAPWNRTQIDSTPCDIRIVREEDRAVIGWPTVTIALDLYSRVILGFSVLLEAVSTSMPCGETGSPSDRRRPQRG